jgi:hypothetical protein
MRWVFVAAEEDDGAELRDSSLLLEVGVCDRSWVLLGGREVQRGVFLSALLGLLSRLQLCILPLRQGVAGMCRPPLADSVSCGVISRIWSRCSYSWLAASAPVDVFEPGVQFRVT